MEIPRVWEIYPELALEVKDMHQQVGLTASGHDVDHDLEVGQLALMVAWPHVQKAAVLAGVGGLLHSIDRILEVSMKTERETVSVVAEESISASVRSLLVQYSDVTDQDSIDRIVRAVVHHGSKPNEPGDDLVMIAVAD